MLLCSFEFSSIDQVLRPRRRAGRFPRIAEDVRNVGAQ